MTTAPLDLSFTGQFRLANRIAGRLIDDARMGKIPGITGVEIQAACAAEVAGLADDLAALVLLRIKALTKPR
jgi:hypothetical protein